MTGDSARLVAARERVAAATAALGEIGAQAEGVRRVRAARWARWRTVMSMAAATATALLIVVAVVMTVIAQRSDDDTTRLDDVLTAARHAVTVTLTADPTSPAAYVNAVRAVAGGEFLRRVDAASQAIEAAVAAQGLPSTGQVVSAGVVGPGVLDGVGSRGPVPVLVVAQATNPQLLGGAAGDNRLVLDVQMVRSGAGWTLDEANLR